MMTSIATAAGITNFTVSDMFVSTHALGGNNDASAAKNLNPWTLATTLAVLAGLQFV
jgi:hypothetical protein